MDARQDEGGGYPALLGEGVEVGGDSREGSREDGLVECNEEERGEEGAEDDSELAARQDGALLLCHECWSRFIGWVVRKGGLLVRR